MRAEPAPEGRIGGDRRCLLFWKTHQRPKTQNERPHKSRPASGSRLWVLFSFRLAGSEKNQFSVYHIAAKKSSVINYNHVCTL